jgi:hypothetical protein
MECLKIAQYCRIPYFQVFLGSTKEIEELHGYLGNRLKEIDGSSKHGSTS